ncbi:MAG: hypothetical protein COB36_14815 [Alphaproteobacteria bacterium]|nr:MAG: hypothetical protein COB36_14815 [Alphaproteobacteria bacterium]
MKLSLVTETYNQAIQGSRSLNLENMVIVEQPDKTSRLQTRLGSKPFYGLNQNIIAMNGRDGTFGGDLFVVTKDGLYRIAKSGVSTKLGSLGAGNNASIAVGRQEVLVCIPPNVWSYDGTSLVSVNMNDTDVSWVEHVNQRFIAVKANSDRFYWSDLLNGRAWPELNFMTAEGAADNIVSIVSLGSLLITLGSSTAEAYANTVQPNSASEAFTRYGNPVEIGCKAAYSAAKARGTVMWVANNGAVYRSSGMEPRRVSTSFIEQEITRLSDKQLAEVKGFMVPERGRWMYVLNLPSVGTYVYDMNLEKWSKRSSGSKQWADMGLLLGGQNYIASSFQDEVSIQAEIGSDAGKPFKQVFSATLSVSRPAIVREIIVDGWANAKCGVYMKWTENNGRTWSDEVKRNISSPDAERDNAVWRRGGTVRAPGRTLEFTIYEPVQVNIFGVRVNEPVRR